jgi:hypothetical protein
MKKFLLTAVLAFIGAYVFAQERIAVFPFEDMDNVLTRNQAKMFYEEFSNEFKNRMPDRSVVPRLDVDRLINIEMDFQISNFSAQEKTAEMNRVLNGNQILSGYIGIVENNIRITVCLFTYPELDRLPGGASKSVSNITELFNVIPELVQSMQNIIAAGSTDQSIPEGLRYEIVDNMTVTITRYTGNAPIVNIPSRIAGLPVTSIGNEAFYNCRSLTSITIPSSITNIGNNAFDSCSSLTSLTISSSVTNIGDETFKFCENLTGITVDSRNPVYASIDGVLFDKNVRILIKYPEGKNQRTYVIPSSVTSIGNGAFWSCDSLTSVTIPSSVTTIGDDAFWSCMSLTSVTIPSSVRSIGERAFISCNSLTSITISSSVISIREWTFAGCDSLTSITIPSSVTFIGDFAFFQCSKLASVTIPSSVRFIGDGAFDDCSSLTNLTIPSSVTSIGVGSFGNCISLTNVTIPSSVTSIGNSAFYGCRSLTSVTLSRRTRVGEGAFPENARITYRD